MSDPIGSAIGAFASNSVAPIFYNKQASKNLNWLGGKFQGDDATYQNALDAFNAANATTTAQMKAAGAQAGTDYNNLYQQNVNYNPLDTYATLRSGNLAALKDYSGQLEDAGSRNDKMALAAMGMGGSPDSSYATTLRADRVSQNLAPVLGNIMSSLGNDTATIGNQRAQNTGNLVNLIGLRTQAPMTGYGMELDPANALNALRGNQISQLGNTVDVAKNNTAGFQQKTDTLGQIANSMNGFNDSMWQNIGNALSVYSSLYGGGAGGGGGIKTGSAPVGNGTFSPTTTSSTSSPASGGIDMNTIMSLMKMFQGTPSTGSTPMSSMQSPALQQQYDPWANYGGTNGTSNYYDSGGSGLDLSSFA